MLDQNEIAINKKKKKKRAAKSLWEVEESYLYGFYPFFSVKFNIIVTLGKV